jgi:hypothetical protein
MVARFLRFPAGDQGRAEHKAKLVVYSRPALPAARRAFNSVIRGQSPIFIGVIRPFARRRR